MSVSSISTNAYQNANGLTSLAAVVPNAGGSASTGTVNATANKSSLSLAVTQAMAQMNMGSGLSSLLGSTASQSTTDFTSSLLASLQGSLSPDSSTKQSLSGYATGQAATPVTLDRTSSTIKLQTSIQGLISQLDGNNNISNLLSGNPASNAASGLANLQQSFNSLVTNSGGNPSQASLQSFLQTVAINIQGSMSVGNLFNTSA